MTTSFDRVIELGKYINIKDNIKAVFGFTNVFLYTKPGKRLKVYHALKKAGDKIPIFKVFLREDIPRYMHIRENERTGDILLLPESRLDCGGSMEIKRAEAARRMGSLGARLRHPQSRYESGFFRLWTGVPEAIQEELYQNSGFVRPDVSYSRL